MRFAFHSGAPLDTLKWSTLHKKSWMLRCGAAKYASESTKTTQSKPLAISAATATTLHQFAGSQFPALVTQAARWPVRKATCSAMPHGTAQQEYEVSSQSPRARVVCTPTMHMTRVGASLPQSLPSRKRFLHPVPQTPALRRQPYTSFSL